MKSVVKAIFVLVFGVLLVGNSSIMAQDRTEAINAFNEGLNKAKKENYEGAIENFQKVIEIADQIDDQDLKSRATKQLPTLYYKSAVDEYKVYQSSKSIDDLRNAIAEFNETSTVAEKYENTSVASKARNISTQLTYNLSANYYKREMLDSALTAVNRTIKMNANYAKAYYQKALIKKSQGNFDEFLSLIDKTINVGLAVDDTEIVEKAEEKAQEELVFRGVKAMEKKKFQQSNDLLNRALDYNTESADAHYRLAELYNKRANFNAAVNHANKALKYERGGKQERAKIYFELGVALKGQGNKSGACDALSQAAYGSFKANAEHQMEHELKCESLAKSR